MEKAGAAAFRAVSRHPGRVLGMLAEQAAVRALAVAPLWVPLALGRDLLPFVLSVLLCLLLSLLLVFPMRSRAALTLSKLVCSRDIGRLRLARYPALVKAGCLRLFLGGLWGLPFYWLCYQVYLYFFVYDASRYGKAVQRIGETMYAVLPFIDAQTLGLFTPVFCIVLALLLFAYGWHRGVAYDFQMVGDMTAVNGLKIARRVRKNCRMKLFFNLIVSALLLLLPCAAAALVLILRCGGASQALMTVYLAVSTGFLGDPPAFWLAGAAFLLLYLPFLPCRKARNAAVVVNAYER